MHSTETLIHLPGNILCAPLGGCYTILRVGWMLKYVFLGTMWVIVYGMQLDYKTVVSTFDTHLSVFTLLFPKFLPRTIIM